MVQWQGYIRNTSAPSGYTHQLGYFSAGHDAVPPMLNTSFAACKSQCDKLDCFGFCFESNEPTPAGIIGKCFVKNASHFSQADLSSSNHCTGTTPISDCPYNIYRTSGDIGELRCPSSLPTANAPCPA